MALIKITCPECKTKNKVLKDKKVFNCKKCSYTIFSNVEVKERFKLLKKITGASVKNANIKRKENLFELQSGIKNLYSTISDDFKNGKLKDAEKKCMQLFTFDNSNIDKYFYLFLLQLDVSSTSEVYDTFKKLSKKKRSKIMNSNYFQILHQSLEYRTFLNDVIMHTYFKKRKKKNRIKLSILGSN